MGCEAWKVTAESELTCFIWFPVEPFSIHCTSVFSELPPSAERGMFSKEPWNFRNCKAFWLATEASDPEHRRVCVHVTLMGKGALYMHFVCKDNFNSCVF